MGKKTGDFRYAHSFRRVASVITSYCNTSCWFVLPFTALLVCEMGKIFLELTAVYLRFKSRVC